MMAKRGPTFGETLRANKPQNIRRNDIAGILERGFPSPMTRGPQAPSRYSLPSTSKTDLDAIIGQISALNNAAIDPATSQVRQGEDLLRALGNSGDLGAGTGGSLQNFYQALLAQMGTGDAVPTTGGWLDMFVQAMTGLQAANAAREQRLGPGGGTIFQPLVGTPEAEAAQARARQLLGLGPQTPTATPPGNSRTGGAAPPPSGPIAAPPQANTAQATSPSASGGVNPGLDDISMALSPAGGLFGPNGSRRFFYGNSAPVGGTRRRFGARTYL